MGETACEPVHMVDEGSTFCKGNVDRMINSSAELSAPNAPCVAISIIGAQSSGKSYLMNRLFGTKFPEMDARLGWTQTSRGIMMSRFIGSSLLLLDVEGFDGRENGEDTLFENRSTLFALVVSDLMMVNIRTEDISRHQGSGSNVFKTIFRERGKLQGAGFTKILVVLRKNEGETPLEILKCQVLEIMEKNWKDVNNESVDFIEYIKVDIVALPGKNSPEFPTEVTKLRNLLSENTTSKVPASGFSLSSSTFWDTIMENRALDIPSHQVAVASWYCGQLVKDIIKSLDSQKEYKLLKDEESTVRFREISHQLLKTNKAAYNLKTQMYDRDIRDQEREYLKQRLHENINVRSRELIRRVKKNSLEQFIHEINDKSFNGLKALKDYLELKVDVCISNFKNSFEDEKVFDSEILRTVCGELEEELQSFTAKLVKEAKEAKDATVLKNAIKITVHSVLAVANTSIAVAAAYAGQMYMVGPAVAAAANSAGHITDAAMQLAGKSDSPSISQDQDCDKKSD